MPTFLERLSAQKFSSAASTAFDVFVSGDSNARIAVDAGGKITWGAGDGAGDVTLYRSAANALKTDDTFQAAAGLLTLTTSGTPSAPSQSTRPTTGCISGPRRPGSRRRPLAGPQTSPLLRLTAVLQPRMSAFTSTPTVATPPPTRGIHGSNHPVPQRYSLQLDD